MDLESNQNNALAKLPLLKQGDYKMWKIRIEQFFQVQDYALWEVIEHGNSFKPTTRATTNEDGSSTSTTVTVPVTTEEKIQKKNDVKARSMLWMALPNEHLLTFSQYKDAKTMFEAIQARFGGNETTKKTQKTLLKQMYENFNASGEIISQEDLNLKFLRSLLAEWNTHMVVWRNKSDLDQMSFDDLYNNFKIVKQEVKSTVTSSSNSSSHNVAFVSTTNDVNTTSVQVSTISTLISTVDLKQIHDDDLKEMDLKWNLALLSMRVRKFYQMTRRKITIDGSDTAGGPRPQDYRLRNQDNRNRSQDSSKRTVNIEEASPTAMIAIDGAGLKEFQQPEFPGYGVKVNGSVSEKSSNETKKTSDAPIIKDWVSDYDEDESEFREIENVQTKPKQANEPRKISEILGITEKSMSKCCWEHKGLMLVKSQPCWVWRPKVKEIDHVSKNNGSYIWRSPCSSKGGKIAGKGRIKTTHLDFEDVYFVKELKFNLFSVSQMCDKKNSVLFTKTECVILSPDFKLPYEN
ncbi:hypothetical protein Tco_1119975 [Tanacetum coccineum]